LKNLRKLASSGVNFVNAYSNAPLCVPSRSSMFTGRHSSQIQVFSNAFGLAQSRGPSGIWSELDTGCARLAPEICDSFAQTQDHDGTFVDALSRVGYDIHLYGKMHVGANLVRRYAPGGAVNLNVVDGSPFGGWNGHEWDTYAEEWTQETGIMSHLSQDFGRRIARVFDNGVSSTPGEEADYHTAQECSRKLEHGLFAASKPQFLYCSFVAPHPRWITNSTYMDRITLLGDHAVPPLQAKETMHPADWYVTTNKGGVGLDQNSPQDITHARTLYFSVCEHLDDMVGAVLAALDRGGGRDNAYIMFVSDHGEHAFENYQYEKDSFKEASARVPFIVAGPGIPATGPTKSVASLHDVFPTLLAMAGVAQPEERLVGESLLSIANGAKTERSKPYVVGEYHGRHVGTGTFMVRADKYKLIEYGEHQLGGDQWPPQLFDLEADPREFNNLAREMPDKVAEMGRVLRKEIDIAVIDKAKKAQNKFLFKSFIYDKKGAAQNCSEFMKEVYVGFDDKDAQKLSAWLGESCYGGSKLTEGSDDVGSASTMSQKEANGCSGADCDLGGKASGDTDDDCDWGCYLNRYPELNKNVQGNHRMARHHWIKTGRAAGRNCKCDSLQAKHTKKAGEDENSVLIKMMSHLG